MKRILVIGCPGSGKSTFSRALHAASGIPLFHLDMLYWNPDKTTVERTVFRERLAKVMQGDEWIIDGNYASTLEMRLPYCDTVFFLDYPVEVCLDGIAARKGKARTDIPWIESKSDEDEDFLAFVQAFAATQRPTILALLARYSDKNVFVFTSREEAATFLTQFP